MHSRLVLAALAVVLPGAASADSPAVSVETEYLMTLELPIDPTFQAVGPRVVANVLAGGTVHGPKINGTVIAPAGDWASPMPDGSFRLDVRATIKTDDGDFVLIEYGAVAALSKEVFDRFNKGEVVTSNDAYWISAPRFTTSSKKYGWLNQIQAVEKWLPCKLPR